MTYNLNYIKEKARDNKRVVVIIIIILALLIIVPTVMQVVKNWPSDEEENTEEVVQLTNEQNNLVSKYNDSTKELILLLENSKWVDNSGTGNVSFAKNQMTEIKNQQEYKQKFAICAVDKTNENLTQSVSDWTYTLSLLMENGDYKVLKVKKTLQGLSESSPIKGATLQGGNGLFKVSEWYARATNTDDFAINNGNPNANQFIDNKYNEMYQAVKDYCARNYPSISSLDWSGEVDINYLNNTICITFTVPTKTSVGIICSYNKQDGTFNVYKSK